MTDLNPTHVHTISKYGAPMGRPTNTVAEPGEKLHLQKVQIDSQGYDKGMTRAALIGASRRTAVPVICTPRTAVRSPRTYVRGPVTRPRLKSLTCTPTLHSRGKP